MEQIKTINLNGQEINYILTQKKVKNVNLRINSDGIIKISADKSVSVAFIENFIHANSEFILKHLARISDRPKPIEHEFIDGEKFRFLGKNLTLKIINSTKENVSIDDTFLILHTKYCDDTDKKVKLLNKFYSQKCVEIFTEIIEKVFPIFKEMNVKYPVVKIRTMKTKWGSCMPTKNQINLNSKLIEQDKKFIEYVILHEFCHFIHPNHSKDFYGLVEQLMPDWKIRKNLIGNT